MTLGRLALRDLTRTPSRLVLTLAAGAVSVLAFIFLQTAIRLFYADVATSRADRLVVRSKAGFTQPLPLAYFPRIANLPGVSAATYQGWFGGQISDRPKEFFANFYVDAETFLSVFPDYVLPAAQAQAFRTDPCGALVGEALAKRFGWRLGQRVSLKGTLYPGTWDLTVRGIFTGSRPNVETGFLAFGYRCLNERLPESRKNEVGTYVVRVDDPTRSAVLAAEIDRMFRNSPYPTKTESERAFQLGFVAMSSAIVTAIRLVSYLVLLILLLVIGNALAMGVRERTTELATLRALGFRRRQLILLVLGESAALGVGAAIAGSVITPWIIDAFVSQVSERFGALPQRILSPWTVVVGAVATVAVAILAGILPALRAGRVQISEGLRQAA